MKNRLLLIFIAISVFAFSVPGIAQTIGGNPISGVPQASSTSPGVVEYATDAETVTGTATDRATTPANITAKMAAPGAIGGTTPAAGAFTTLKMTTGAAAGVVVSDGSGNLIADTTPALGTPSSGTMDNTTTATAADNTSTTALASTAYAKSQDAVLAREPNQGVALTAAASGGGVAVQHNANIGFGTTTNYTLVWKGSLPNWNIGLARLLNKYHASNNYLLQLTDGNLRLDATGASAVSSATVGFTANTVHELVAVVTRHASAGTVDMYRDGVLFQAFTGLNTSGSVDSGETLNVLGLSTGAQFAGTTHHALTFNRALSAAEVLDLYRNGVAESDKWGSQTSIVTGTDSTFAGASNWANVDLNAYDETTGGVLTITANAANQYCTLPVANATTVSGKKYKLVYDVASIASTWTVKDFGGTQTIGTISANATGASIEFTASTTGGLRLVAVANDSSGVFDNIYLYEIGATLALLPENIQVDKWYDASSNALDGAYPTAGSSLTRPYQLGVESLLSVTNVSFAANADTTLYTVPTGRRAVLTKAIVVAGADAGATTAMSIGANGTETDFLPAAVLSNLDAANDVVILQPAMVAALPVKNKSYAAGTVIQAQVATQSGGATNSVQLFGVLY